MQIMTERNSMKWFLVIFFYTRRAVPRPITVRELPLQVMRSGVETNSQAFCRIWGTPEKRRRKPVGSRGVEDIRRRPWPTNSTKQSSLGHIESDVQSWTLHGSVLGSLKICSGCLSWSFCGHKNGIRTISDSCLFWGHFFLSVLPCPVLI